MGQISRQLYDYLIDNKQHMTDAWFQTHVLGDGSTYTANAPMEVQATVRRDNARFIEAISLVFIEEKETFRQYIEDWAQSVAEARARSAEPLYNVVAQLRIFRNIYWQFIRQFFEEPGVQATAEDALRWSSWMNNAFDYVIESFVLHYQQAHESILARQQQVIDELSSPVIPIKKGIGILPLVGIIDPHRAQVILETALEESSRKGLHTLCIDLSAVPVVDTMVAQQLFQLMKALKIIGVKSVLSGIRPEIAQTAVALGIDFQETEVHANLMRALEAIQKETS